MTKLSTQQTTYNIKDEYATTVILPYFENPNSSDILGRTVTVAGTFWSSSKAPAADAVEAPTSPSPPSRGRPREIMTQPSVQPHLTPQFCFSTTALRDFLRLSRATIDDSITQNLNALSTPASHPFDPTSTSLRTPRLPSRQIEPQACQAFKEKVLFPSWQARTDVLNYCAAVATSPDPDDPDTAAREAELMRNREKVVDERLDPYSGRFFPKEARTERLALVIRQEWGVENIVRTRSWGVVKERCDGEVEEGWEGAIGGWRGDGQKR